MQRLATLAAAAWLCATLLSAQTIQVDKNNRTIAVTASDTATTEANLASITVGFETWAPDAATAYRQGSQLSNAIVDALKNSGVPDKSIESRAQNLSKTDFPFNPAPTPEERAQKAFTLSQSWIVHTSAADAAKVLQAAVEAGANDSGSIDWDVADRKSLEANAAAKALVDAHAIAAQMAAGLGVTLGPLVYASNQAPERPVLPFIRMGAAKAAPPPVKPLALRPQQVQESATVYAVFSIE
ncbi:MAG: SIMPL domain-containing protein [Acidobacteriaceae bacterium]